jgi:putative ABC transport system substrate-binding protein
MNRRAFITLLGGAAAWPLAARAQQPERMRRIGVLMPAAADDSEYQARMAAFLQGLQQLGWADGRNVRIDRRWGGGDADRTRKYAAELVALAPDVVMAFTSVAVASVRQVTRTTPTRLSPIRSAPAMSRAWHGRAVTSLALAPSNMPLAGNGWNCSNRSPPAWSERRSFEILP